MADPKLLTVDEFNSFVRKWAQQVRMSSASTLMMGTHSSGKLLQSLVNYVDLGLKTKAAYKVKFHFERYGVFRFYGVGRGYVRYNGVVKRGYRLKTLSSFEEWEKIVSDSLRKGMKSKDINALKTATDGDIRRTPLDWYDSHIESNIPSLADMCQTYYGDKALLSILENFKNIKIDKNG